MTVKNIKTNVDRKITCKLCRCTKLSKMSLILSFFHEMYFENRFLYDYTLHLSLSQHRASNPTWKTTSCHLISSVCRPLLAVCVCLCLRCWIKRSRSSQPKMSITLTILMPLTLSCWSPSSESWRKEKASKSRFTTSLLTADAKNGWEDFLTDWTNSLLTAAVRNWLYFSVLYEIFLHWNIFLGGGHHNI